MTFYRNKRNVETDYNYISASIYESGKAEGRLKGLPTLTPRYNASYSNKTKRRYCMHDFNRNTYL